MRSLTLLAAAVVTSLVLQNPQTVELSESGTPTVIEADLTREEIARALHEAGG